ncbi:MAG: hypothetical protein O4965_31090 [Trichodesmium sp. St19_bin1]|nr:hypothetical protein [Trichodesmium sp. St19_bin1]
MRGWVNYFSPQVSLKI